MAEAAEIADALLARCEDLSVASPGLPIAFPEVGFSPPEGAYLDVRLFMNGQAWTGLTGGKIDQGILQIMVVAPRQRGVIKGLAIADQVAANFPFATKIGPAKMGLPDIGSPISEDDRLLITVRMPWTA